MEFNGSILLEFCFQFKTKLFIQPCRWGFEYVDCNRAPWKGNSFFPPQKGLSRYDTTADDEISVLELREMGSPTLLLLPLTLTLTVNQNVSVKELRKLLLINQ